SQLGHAQAQRTVIVPAQRGSILDRNGNELAVSVDATTIYADPRVITDPLGEAAKLAPVVGVDEATLRARLADGHQGFVYVARKVDPKVAAAVRKLDLPGIGYESEPKRYDPANPLAAPLLGFVGTDNTGLAGIEASEQSTLAGRPGRLVVEEDPRGQALPNSTHQAQPARQGADVQLTIDQSMQYAVEQALTSEVAQDQAKGGMAILADTRTGDVLAMASVDAQNGTTPAGPSNAAERNRPLTDVFEPGSTAKVVTIAAAIQAGLVSPSTVLSVPDAITVDGVQYADVDTHPTQMSVADILRESSNVGTIEIAQMLGRDRFDAALREFGFGAPTGTGFPGEAAGILLPKNQYNATSMASMPIGSGIAVTAMQLLDVYMTIADGGMARPPRLVAATVDAQGQRHPTTVSAPHQVVSATAADEVRQMLIGVVAGGTGTRAQLPNYLVAGKTGTARKPPYNHPPYNYVADFAGFAPADNPRLAAVVVLDGPQGAVFGGDVAAPVFAHIMQYALTVERVPASPLQPGAGASPIH
ncbi:MAG TPA: penicillin-binding protein 2, partial [Acidimicrobiia bacterium]|nr:penicillin-binding protein 2 [Acidimicrobiia bacterium]